MSLFIGISGFKLNPRNYWCAAPCAPQLFALPTSHAVRILNLFTGAGVAMLHCPTPPSEPAPGAPRRRNGRWTSTWRLTDISAGAGTLVGESNFLVRRACARAALRRDPYRTAPSA